MIPDKLIITVEDGVLTEARVESCESTEVVVTNWQTASKLSSHMFLSRIDILAEDSVDLLVFARQIALERDYWVWAVTEGQVHRFGLMTYHEAKGVSIFIPWSIVILNVVFTMVNAIYERKGELVILSSVGLNPTHITALFVAEALIVGVIGGGMGYLLGLSLYELMPLLSINIFVRQKISAVWCLASLGIAMTAVLVGAFVALKTSVDITPSKLRRWTSEVSNESGTPGVFDVPFRVQVDRLDSLFENIVTRFRRYLMSRGINEDIGRIEFANEETPDESIRTIHFNYLLGDRSKIGALPFQLVAKKRMNEDVYTFKVVCNGADETIKGTVNFIHRAIIEWSSQHHSN
jgi:hypothetical protein